MAKNKVEVDVKVDDKGTTRKVGLGAKKAADGLDQTAKGAHSADRQLKGAAQASSNTTKNFSKMSQGITGGLVPAYATLAANLFALSAAFNFLKNAADIRNLRESQIQFTETTGAAMGILTKNLREAADGMLSFQAAAQASAIGLAKGFSPQQMESIATGARKVSTALGRDFEDAFDRLVRGASKAEPELLDELGITLRLANATDKYAQSIGKNVKELTEYERSQAVLEETMGQLEKQFGKVIPKTNEFTKLGKTFGDVIEKVSDVALPAIEAFVGFINDNMESAVAIVGLFGASILQSALNFGALEEAAMNFTENSMAGVTEAQKNLQSFQDYGQQTLVGKGRVAQATGKRAQGAMQGIDTGKSKIGAQMSQSGTAGLNANQRKSALRALTKAENQIINGALNVQTGMYKGASAKQLAVIKQGLMGAEAAATKTAKGMATKMEGAFFQIQLAAKKTQVVVSTAFTRMGQAASKAGMLMGKAMNAFMIAGMAVMAFQAIKAIMDKMAEGQPKAMDFSEANEKVAESFKDITEAVNAANDAIANSETAAERSAKRLTALSTIDFSSQVKKIRGSFTGAVETQRAAAETALAAMGGVRDTTLQKSGIQTTRSGRKTTRVATDADKAAQEEAIAHNEKIKQLKIDIESATLSVESATKKEDAAIKALAEQARKLGNEKLADALAAGDIAAIEEIQKKIGLFNGNLKEYEASLNSLADMNGMAAEKQYFYLESLKDTATNLNATAEELGEATDALARFEEVMAKSGMTSTEFQQKLKDIADESDRIRTAQSANQVQGLQNQVQVSGLLREKETERLALSAKQLEADKTANTLAQAKLGLTLDGTKIQEDQQARALQIATEQNNVAQQGLITLETQQSDSFKIMSAASNAFESSLVSGLQGIFDGTMSVKDAFKNMAKNMIASIMQVTVKMLALKMIESSFGFSFAGGGIASPGGARAATSGRGYATGGIPKGSSRGYQATLHGTEAVVPLPNGRSIPVEMKGRAGMGGDTNNVTINVTNTGAQGNQGPQTDVQSNEAQLGRVLQMAVTEELKKQKRPGGLLSPYGAD